MCATKLIDWRDHQSSQKCSQINVQNSRVGRLIKNLPYALLVFRPEAAYIIIYKAFYDPIIVILDQTNNLLKVVIKAVGMANLNNNWRSVRLVIVWEDVGNWAGLPLVNLGFRQWLQADFVLLIEQMPQARGQFTDITLVSLWRINDHVEDRFRIVHNRVFLGVKSQV